MKLFAAQPSESWSPSPHCANAFTLTEMMVAMSIFSLAIGAIMACHIGGLEFNEFVRPKVVNSQYARETLSRLIEEVRSATSTQVGTGTVSSFIAAGPNQSQAGNALRIYTTTNSSSGPYIYYFADSASGNVQKIPLGGGNAITIATAVTNAGIFSMEDRSGTVLTNSQNNAVLSVLLQMLRPSSKSGMSDAYQIRAKTTRRNIL